MNPVDPTPDAPPADAPMTPLAAAPDAPVIVPAPEPPADAPATPEVVAEALPADLLPPDAPPPPPALPAQPVPEVPAAPQPHDLSRIAQDLQVRKAQVEAVVQLLDSDNTVPFITRYRKERTGGLDEVAIRRIQDRVQHLRDLQNRKQTILRTIANQGRLTDDLVAAILETEHPKRLEDLYLPYKPKKRTLATDAKEKGLEPLAQAIWNRDPAVANLEETLAAVVDPWKQLHGRDDVAAGVRHILAEVVAELAEVRGPMRMFVWDTAMLAAAKSDTLPDGKGKEYKDYFNFREPVRLIPPHRVLAVNRGEREQALKVRMEFDPNIARDIVLSNLPLADHPHREFLLPAVEDALTRLIVPSLEREVRRELTDMAQGHAIHIFARNLRSLLLRPPLGGKRVLAIDPGIRTGCKLAALDETGALLEETVVFPHPPQKKVGEAKRKIEQLVRKYQTPVVAIGNGTACRETEQLVADLIAEFEDRRLNPTPTAPAVTAETPAPPPPPAAESVATPTVGAESSPSVESVMANVLGDHAETSVMHAVVLPGEAVVSAPGEGGAPPAEPTVVQAPAVEAAAPPAPPIDLSGLPEPPADLVYVIVTESGASDYSASPIAKDEFPNLDATARGTISIGRRLQDPLAELVKIDPQHIGVGLYQHDVKAKQLKESLEGVVESCVNAVGVDLNTASVPLLRHVSGLNQLVAKELVEYRKKNGPYNSRDDLKNVPQMGDVRFTQAAGFLKIRGGGDPLDATWVHPESYPVARQFLADLGFQPADIRDRTKLSELRDKLRTVNPAEVAQRLDAGEPTVRDIFDALARPDRDIREDRPAPIFRKGVLKIEDLKAGMELRGEVLNVVDFGAFVDVGLKDSGLVHISQMANRYIKSPYEVIAVGDVVPVWVISVDADMGRVSLTMLHPSQERRPQGPGPRPPMEQRGERPPQGDRPPREPRGERPPQQQGPRPGFGGPPRGDRPAPAPRPPQPQGDRPAQAPRPGGFGQRPGGPPRPGGGFKPRGPGAPGWRNSPKPAEAKPAPAADAAPAAEAQPAKPKTPAKPKATTKLTEVQKAGKAPVNSFAQLAALLRAKDEPEAKPADPPAAPDQPAG
jgi:uncharacterized protein